MMLSPRIVRTTLGLLLIATLGLSFQMISAAQSGEGPEQTKPPASGRFVPGEVLVKFKRDAPLSKMQTTLLAQNARTVGEIPALGVQRLNVPQGQELAIIEALQHNPLVEYAEPNYIIRAIDTIPDDTYFNPPYSRQWGLTKIQAPAAWDITTGSSDITIAIVDSGIDLGHDDLIGKIWGNPDEIPNGLDDDGNGKIDDMIGWDFVNDDNDPQDDYSHGTHVAGIAAAETNNGMGVAGVSWGARLMVLKVLNSGGTGSYENVAYAVTYAADKGAKIINLSLGGDEDSLTLRNAVIYAHNAGCVVVAATGNNNGSVLYPAKYAEAFAVASTDSSDQRYSDPFYGSNYGPEVDIAAPGVSIYSTNLGGGYIYKTGTSMATPHVAGLAALIWSVCPDYTNDQVESQIETTAVDLGTPGWDQYYGHGRIDAYAALQCARNLGANPQSVAFLADDTTDPIPSSHTVDVLNTGCEPITWTVTISPPTTTWLTATPLSGTASITSPASISLSASKTVTYGTYNAQVIITTTQTPVWGNPETVDVKLTHMAELYKLILILILKNYSQ